MKLQATSKTPHRCGRRGSRRTSTCQLCVTEQKSALTVHLSATALKKLMANPSTSLSIGSSWLLPYRIYINFVSESLFRSTPWDCCLKGKKWVFCDSSLGCWGRVDDKKPNKTKNPTAWSLQKAKS